MANIDNPNGFRPVVTLIGQGFPMWEGLIRSNSLVSTGDALFATAGYIVPISATTVDKMPLGVAVTPVTASVTRRVSMLFYPAVDWYIFEGQTSGAMTQAKVWTLCDIEGARGTQEVNEDARTLSQMIIVGVTPGTSFGTWARVRFVFSKSKFTGKQGGTAAAILWGA